MAFFKTNKKTNNRKKTAIKSVTDIIPIVDMWGEEGDPKRHFICKDGTHIDLYRINTFDLNSLSDEETQLMVAAWQGFYQTYPCDLKIISLNFPTDTSRQRAYFNDKLNNCPNEIYERFLRDKYTELEYVEKSGMDRYFYFVTFSKDEEEYVANDSLIRNRLGGAYTSFSYIEREIPFAEKVSVIARLAEKNREIDKNDELFCLKTPIEKQERETKAKGYNPYLLADIQPQANVSFRDERFMKTGEGYESCITIYRFPPALDLYWLLQTMSLDNAVAILDIHTQDQLVTKRNINEAIRENEKRQSEESDTTAYDIAVRRTEELRDYYTEIDQHQLVSKEITLRIFLYAKTYQDIDEITASRMEKVKSDSYKAAVFINESKADWQSQFLSYTQQQKTIYGRVGQACLTKTLAKGLPFYFTNVDDPCGSYLGTTNSNQGACLLDIFENTSERTSYNTLMVGGSGSGKSSTIKKLMLDNAIRGNYIRVIDPTGEYTTLVKALGGSVISLDGTKDVLNAFEILRTSDEGEGACWSYHLAKMQACYSMIAPQADGREVSEFIAQITDFYDDYGLVKKDVEHNEQEFTNLPHDRYPIWSDFLAYIKKTIAEESKKKTVSGDEDEELVKKSSLARLERLDNIYVAVNGLLAGYGNIVNGRTNVNGRLFESPVLSFDTTNLAKVDATIFDMQIYLAIQMCWDNCLKLGSDMKAKYGKTDKDRRIRWEDITRFAIIIDESHRLLNAEKIGAVNQILTIQREARKYFGGVWLASQNIRDFVPEGASSEAENKIITMFGMTTYKFLLRQDSNAQEMLGRIFGKFLTQADIESLPAAERGEALLCMGEKRKVHVSVSLSDEELYLFQGGA